MYRNGIKRFLDFMLSLMGIIVLSPVLLVLWILVRVKLGFCFIRRDRADMRRFLSYISSAP